MSVWAESTYGHTQPNGRYLIRNTTIQECTFIFFLWLLLLLRRQEINQLERYIVAEILICFFIFSPFQYVPLPLNRLALSLSLPVSFSPSLSIVTLTHLLILCISSGELFKSTGKLRNVYFVMECHKFNNSMLDTADAIGRLMASCRSMLSFQLGFQVNYLLWNVLSHTQWSMHGATEWNEPCCIVIGNVAKWKSVPMRAFTIHALGKAKIINYKIAWNRAKTSHLIRAPVKNIFTYVNCSSIRPKPTDQSTKLFHSKCFASIWWFRCVPLSHSCSAFELVIICFVLLAMISRVDKKVFDSLNSV